MNDAFEAMALELAASHESQRSTIQALMAHAASLESELAALKAMPPQAAATVCTSCTEVKLPTMKEVAIDVYGAEGLYDNMKQSRHV